MRFVAFGYIMVDKETEVLFQVNDGVCKVSEKDFGQGTFRHTFKKGKYPIELSKRHGHGQANFKITGTAGEQVLFYTGELLSRELNRSIKVEKKTYKSKMLVEPSVAP